jgi:hypothetical protein
MFAGLIPFVVGASAIALKVDNWWIISDVTTSFAFYALAIASFMSGVHWGVAQLQGNKTTLLLHSNLMVLLPWVAFVVFGDGVIFYLLLAYVFLKQYLVDRLLTSQGVFSHEYLNDRLIVATTVCILMVIVAGVNAY